MNRDDAGALPEGYIRSCDGLGPGAETGDGPCGGDPAPHDHALTQQPGDER